MRIRAYELAPEGSAVSPYVIAFDGDRRVPTTRTAAACREAEWGGSRPRRPAQPSPCRDGQPIFFEIWDDGYFGDALVGGFVVYADGRSAAPDNSGGRVAEFTVPIFWDWKEPGSTSRPGYAQVRFTHRPPPPGGVTPEPGARR